ncbi:glycine receptor subunit alpha-2-like [Panulirus ornatus]|uniref:glycine receptor subunit alpha-2-like n=1 Tax=Panulirus ornatus TaxID=150431 RepID=UPI003A867E03
MYKRLTLPQFQLKEIKVDTCTQSFHIGNYSCLQAVFELERNIGYHLVQSYLPTSLIVVVSWVSFWLDVDAIPSRVTLGVTTLLTVCSESTSFRDNMPVLSYVEALDIWMGSCTAFVFLALLEFTVVSHIARHHRRFLFWVQRTGVPSPPTTTAALARPAGSDSPPSTAPATPSSKLPPLRLTTREPPSPTTETPASMWTLPHW